MPELISHTLVIGLSVAIIIGLVAILNGIRDENRFGIAHGMAEDVCAQIKLASEQLSQSSLPVRAHLRLPVKIGGDPYYVRTNSHNITVASSNWTVECVSGSAFGLSGNSVGGPVDLAIAGDKIMLSGV